MAPAGPHAGRRLPSLPHRAQSGALFDSLTVGDNVGFLLNEHTALPAPKIQARRRAARSLRCPRCLCSARAAAPALAAHAAACCCCHAAHTSAHASVPACLPLSPLSPLLCCRSWWPSRWARWASAAWRPSTPLSSLAACASAWRWRGRLCATRSTTTWSRRAVVLLLGLHACLLLPQACLLAVRRPRARPPGDRLTTRRLRGSPTDWLPPSLVFLFPSLFIPRSSPDHHV